MQFETIHPRLAGNGRLGRLLISLLLHHWGLLSRPLLHLSLFLKEHRQEHHRRLAAVRTDGDWEGVAVVADEAISTARRLHAIVGRHRGHLLTRDDTTVLSLRLFETLPEHPILTVNGSIELLGCTRPAALKAVGVPESAGIVSAVDDRKRSRAMPLSPVPRRHRP